MAKIKTKISRTDKARAERYEMIRNEIEALELGGSTRTDAIKDTVIKHRISTATIYKAINKIL